jgi:DNA (cytosine-5)-methyltransferase 1
LDAQNFGVPQRRRRIFIVGSLGNLGSGKVLFEQGCLQADFGACEETGEEVAGTFSTGFGSRRMSINGIGGGGIPQSCVAYTEGSIGSYVPGVGTLRAAGGDLGHGAENLIVYSDDAEKSTGLKQRIVRKLTPVECERLQGFPDNYTRIPWRKKAPEDCPDGLRYKVLGNSMAVPVMRWIGERINKVDSEVFRKWDYIL